MPPSPPAGTEPSPSSPTTASPPTTRPRILPTLPTLPPLLPRLTVPELRALAVDAHHARAPEPPYALGIAAAVAGATLIVLVGAEVILYRRSRK